MAMYSNAAMVLYYDFDGDPAEHDDWHTYEHMHERLSIPGFLRGTRWVARSGGPRYLIVYEVTGVEVATSPAYLARLDDPTPWTASTMARLRGMIRGFSKVTASSGYGLGSTALSIRFLPRAGTEAKVRAVLQGEVLPAIASRRGLAGVHLLEPAARPPMTREQSIRGPDSALTWVLIVTAYDADVLQRALADDLADDALACCGIALPVERASYALQYTVTSAEVAASPPNPALAPQARGADGVRR